MIEGFVFVDIRVSNYDDNIAWHAGPCGWTVEHHYTGVFGRFDCVSNQPVAVVDVQNVNLFARQNIRCTQKHAINRDASLVMKIGRR